MTDLPLSPPTPARVRSSRHVISRRGGSSQKKQYFFVEFEVDKTITASEVRRLELKSGADNYVEFGGREVRPAGTKSILRTSFKKTGSPVSTTTSTVVLDNHIITIENKPSVITVPFSIVTLIAFTFTIALDGEDEQDIAITENPIELDPC